MFALKVCATIQSNICLHAIRLIKNYLSKNEIKMLLTSNFYSILYYNCEIWLMNSLNVVLKRHLLAASANALKILNNRSDLRISYDQIHRINKRAAPIDMMKYKLAIQLHKIHNVNNTLVIYRLGVLNNNISYDSLNLSLNAFKLHCKNLFLTNQ